MSFYPERRQHIADWELSMVLQGGEEAIRQCVPNRYSMIQFKYVQKVKMLYSASQIFTMLYRLMFEKSLAVLTDLGTRATIAKLLGKAIKHNYGVHTMEHLEGIRTIWKQIKYDKIVWNRCGWLLQSPVSTVANQVQIKCKSSGSTPRSTPRSREKAWWIPWTGTSSTM